MTKLLISVRSASEAHDALAGGADLIDVKEPNRGSLGAADASVIAEVIAAVAGRTPISTALGELLEARHEQENESLHSKLQSLPAGLSFAKLGLAGCARQSNWRAVWRAAVDQLPRSIKPVAVVYADHQMAAAPSPLDVLNSGCELGCQIVLIDTFHKDRGSLLDRWPAVSLIKFIQHVRRRNCQLALAGGLNLETLARALELQPDILAFRGAACGGSREGSINRTMVGELATILVPA